MNDVSFKSLWCIIQKILLFFVEALCDFIRQYLLYLKMSISVHTLDDGNFVSWSADDFTNDTSLIVSSDRWIFQLSVNEYEKLLQLCKFTARQVVLYKQKIGDNVCYCYVQFNDKRDVDKMFVDQLAILKLFKPIFAARCDQQSGGVEVNIKLYIPPNLIYYVL